MQNRWRHVLNLLWPENQLKTSLPLNLGMVQGVQFVSQYRVPGVQRAITTHKYQGNQTATSLLTELLDQYLSQTVGATSETITVIPMPISYRRWRERGYNHITELAKPCRFRLTIRDNVLQRRRHTTQQTKMNKLERTKQQHDSFHCHQVAARQLTGTVILLDDVVTTGATMAAARATLAPHLLPDTKLICLALAH